MRKRSILTSAAMLGGLTLALVPAIDSMAGTTPEIPTAANAETRLLGGSPTVPTDLAVPAGNVLSSVFKASGVQIYGCTDAKWTLIEPAATLTGVHLGKPGRPATALHFRGPSWQSDQDGSLVEGTTPVSAPSATPNSITQLRVTAKTTRGPGVFGQVTFIQRLNTVGGVAPTTACAAGETKAVPYRAVYRFFTKA